MLLVIRSGSYTRAGIVVAVYVTGSGVAGPVLGRLVDRFGRAFVLRPAALAEASLLCVLALLPSHAVPGILVCALGAGLCTPPVVAAARSLWPEVLPSDQLPAVYALEATLQELVYIVGPSLVAVVVSVSGPQAAVIVSAGVLVVGVMAFSLHLATRRPAVSGPAHMAGRRRRGLPISMALVAAAMLIVGAFSFVELSTVAFARGHRAAGAAGVVLAVWSAGSLTGGLLLGTRAGSARTPRRRLAFLLLLLAASTLLPVLADRVWLLGVLLFFAGIAIAPTFASLYALAASEVPAARQTEAFGWLSAGFQVGGALGSLGAGVVVQIAGPHIGYLAAAGLVALGAPGIALASRRRPLPVADPQGQPPQG